ncbi:hypothetical protein DL98DRAFT_250687 [Cadophora sp. DSE1049]|nr:hypothetical protein DL98DRAFT_250687 [Cadophora sp. DSE1049]
MLASRRLVCPVPGISKSSRRGPDTQHHRLTTLQVCCQAKPLRSTTARKRRDLFSVLGVPIFGYLHPVSLVWSQFDGNVNRSWQDHGKQGQGQGTEIVASNENFILNLGRSYPPREVKIVVQPDNQNSQCIKQANSTKQRTLQYFRFSQSIPCNHIRNHAQRKRDS